MPLRHHFLLVLALLVAAPAGAELVRPDILVITVDTLRYDRLSIHGYHRPTSPHLDALLEKSARFDQARVVEPLTGPSMASMLTSRHPHQHAASRNGLAMRPELLSLPKILARRGYRTVAFVGNWTLSDELIGLAEHFDEYHEVLNRKRYLFLKGEATGDDLTDDALDWIEEHRESEGRKPFFLWVHYVEPHAPYRLQEEFIEPLGLPGRRRATKSDHYDTEVAFVDRAIGRLLEGALAGERDEGTLISFSSDHGESLGEHGYWGHGRFAYDATLKIPMSFTWGGRIAPRVLETAASNLDIAPTILGLVGLPSPESFEGFDYSAVFRGEESAPARRTRHQAHRGAVQGEADKARQKGLLEIAFVENGRKEVFRPRKGARRVYDLEEDPEENENLVDEDSAISEALRQWLEDVEAALVEADVLPAKPLDEESLKRMKALGYID